MIIPTKIDRQKLVLQLVHKTPIATQSDLQQKLRVAGIKVDQATLSRDIHELGLVRAAFDKGYRYALIEEVSPTVPQKSMTMMKRFVREIDFSCNQIIIKTDAGAAPPVAEALDHMSLEEILGTVAGDNTVLVVVRESYIAKRVVAKLRRLLH